MERTVHLVRHAEAASGDDADGGLSDRGRRQAAAVAARLATIGVDAVLHGPKRRAAETADIVAAHLGVPQTASPLVDDRTPYARDRATVPARFHAVLDGVPDDERDDDAHELDAAVAAIGRPDVAPSRLVVVTHNFVIGWFVRHALDAPAWRWLGLNQANAALTTICYRPDGPRLITFNDTGHLPPG